MKHLTPTYNLDGCELVVVRDLCERFHGYGRWTGNSSTYAFAVWEEWDEQQIAVAAYTWQPPAPGAARSVCPEAPHAVLALSRMVALPKEQRRLQHVSRPLRRQMRILIDRSRWPVLVTYSDEGQWHTGHVYKCSGWTPTKRSRRPVYVDRQGRRVSSYSDGHHDTAELRRDGWTWVQRWEHWVCERGMAHTWLDACGWRRVPVPGVKWRSGNQAYRFVQKIGA